LDDYAVELIAHKDACAAPPALDPRAGRHYLRQVVPAIDERVDAGVDANPSSSARKGVDPSARSASPPPRRRHVRSRHPTRVTFDVMDV
jgi:hypothetical protein